MSTEIVHPHYPGSTHMWPGQAMTLKVEKVLHHEKSLYQDSTDYGNVLDEFSYQEMITHLAMNSHPNPKKVLVIGGGDGGVLREVVKHECVEEAILCDIDEAVIRLSKQNTFDVIITDSSDPDGPAEALFQKSYFELLSAALKEGGVITTQAENQWLHLKLITELKKSCREVFPTVEYAYTTIPTYPSGQIGFMVCSKDANRDVSKPLRSLPEEEENKRLPLLQLQDPRGFFSSSPNFAKVGPCLNA
ncbi:S-adenosyl-L-methionine-dependent methyltransferase [Pyronema omphalodes]|nr:S-adenosyl-L-methionine-dependent methyltransferase [Pyronema omphalodes]